MVFILEGKKGWSLNFPKLFLVLKFYCERCGVSFPGCQTLTHYVGRLGRPPTQSVRVCQPEAQQLTILRNTLFYSFKNAHKAQYWMRRKKKSHGIVYQNGIQKRCLVKEQCPDGINCKREWSSFICNLLFSVGTKISTGSFAIKSQMVKMNCPMNYPLSACVAYNHGSFKLSFLKQINLCDCWVEQWQKLLQKFCDFMFV